MGGKKVNERVGEQYSQDQKVRQEPERRTAAGSVQGCSLEQKRSRVSVSS